MQRVNTRSILKKVDEWKSVPSMVPAVYRLFVFLKWEDIPEQYRNMYDQRAAEIWNDDLDKICESIEEDSKTTINAVLNELRKKNFVSAFGLAPILLADLFVRGIKTGAVQGLLSKAINNYSSTVQADRVVAEVESLFHMQEFLESVCKKGQIKLDYSIEKVIDELANAYYKKLDEEKIQAQVEEVLKKYDEAHDVRE